MGIVRKVLLGLENRAGCIFSLLTDSQYKDSKAFPKRQKMKCMILVFFLLF
jgi:hypothetical protein